jgi:hypothetical protein
MVRAALLRLNARSLGVSCRGEPRIPRDARVSDPRLPDGGPIWPEHDLSPDAASGAPPQTETAPPTTAFTQDSPEPAARVWDPKLQGERRRPTTAEQAVPWLIGVVLALIGIVVVLLALIFTGPEGLGVTGSTATPTATPQSSPEPSRSGRSIASASASPSTPAPERTDTPTPTPTPAQEYGPLEMVYLGRPSTLAPVYVLRRDFSERGDPRIVAQADEGVERLSWSPDGRVGAAIIAGRAVALRRGSPARRLVDGVSALTFGWDAETIYAMRVVQVRARDRATLLEIDFVTGASKALGSVTYPHPQIGAEAPLQEAQFIDDGGTVRLYPTADGFVVAWILGAPATYRFDPGDGSVVKVSHAPQLWSPDGQKRVASDERANGTTVLRLRTRGDPEVTSVTVDGLVSHIRWAPGSNEIAFTLGTPGPAGGVHQDLYVWDLRERHDPLALTADGASFGAEWVGTMPNWVP